jgi:hypothetical protein
MVLILSFTQSWPLAVAVLPLLPLIVVAAALVVLAEEMLAPAQLSQDPLLAVLETLEELVEQLLAAAAVAAEPVEPEPTD